MRTLLLRSLSFAALSLAGACGDISPAPAPSLMQTTAFTNVTLIAMTDERVMPDQTVLINAGRIAEIGHSAQTKIPPGALTIDGRGAYLMPGLADMHMHTTDAWLRDWPVSPFDLYLANGVTTIRDMGSNGQPPTYALRWRDQIAEGRRRGPTLYVGARRRGGGGDMAGFVAWAAGADFDFVKMYSFLSKAEFRAAMARARKLGVYTAGHIPFAVGLDDALSEGMDEIAHVEELDFEFLSFDRSRTLQPREWFAYIMEAAVEQVGSEAGFDTTAFESENRPTFLEIADKLKSADIPICTTLAVADIIVRKLLHAEAFLARPENRYLPRSYLRSVRQGREKHQVQFKGNEEFGRFKYAMERILLAELHQAGVRLVLGTDAGTGAMGIVPGYSIHDELRILVETGFTPYEAITGATVAASQVVDAMTGTDEFGTIEVGKRADLLLVNRNPLESVGNIKDLRGVMSAGRWYAKQHLERLITEAE